MRPILIILAIVLILILIITSVISAYLLSYISRRKLFPIPKKLLQRFQSSLAGNDNTGECDNKWKEAPDFWIKQQELEQLYLKNTKGQTLHAQFLPTKSKRKAIILACHGSRSSGIGEFCYISRFLSEQGYDLFLVDHRACGESEGLYMGYGYFESEDTMLWLEQIEKRFGSHVPVFLYGVSMGAATVMMMSNKNLPENVKGIIADCGYTSAWKEFEYQLKESFHMSAFPMLPIVNCFSILLAGYSFKKANPLECVKKAKVPILFIHGEKDHFVPCRMVHELYEACASQKDLLVVKDALHAKSYQTDPEGYGVKFLEFCNGRLLNNDF